MVRPNPPLSLLLAVPLSLATMLWSAQHDHRAGLATAALAFAALASWESFRIARAHRRNPTPRAATAASHAFSDISRITATVYGWGGLSLIALYRFTPLHWQHGWQYGSAMLLVALGLVIYIVRERRAPQSEAGARGMAALAAVHGLAAAGALGWLVFSGKLATTRGDWAANAIFVAGGVTITVISLLAILTHLDLRSGTVQR